MRINLSRENNEPRLRLVFADTSIALDFSPGSTLGDIAGRVGAIARQHKGSLLSIDVRMAARGNEPASAVN